MSAAFVIHPLDNVATLLGDAGDRVTLNDGREVRLAAAVAHGHKVALADIPGGAAVVKFGIPIGVASADIARGDWVHLHNVESRYDERSGGFDVVTGAAGDMRYD